MKRSKPMTQELYETLEQQKRLQELRGKLVGVVNKINQVLNSITVENLELTNSQIEGLKEDEDDKEKKPEIYDPVQQERKAEEINRQLIDLETRFSQYDDETDEELV